MISERGSDPTIWGAERRSSAFQTARTRRCPSGEMTARMCFPSGEIETLLIAGLRAKAEASG
ncbi:hypothetical protein D3C80_2104240 [compost metagenome]